MAVKGARKILELKRRRARESEGKFLIEGIRLCEEALTSLAPVEQLVFSRESLERNTRLSRLHQTALEKRVLVQMTSHRAFQGMSETQTPQGVLGVVDMPDPDRRAALESASTLLVLDRLSDPGNLGMILRTAEAAGVSGVFITRGSVDLFNPKVVRATMGAIFRLPIFTGETPLPLCDSLRNHGIPILAASPDGLPYSRLPAMGRVALVLGNEAFGIDPDFLRLADITASIPMAPPVDSLNVAIAAGILLYRVHELRNA